MLNNVAADGTPGWLPFPAPVRALLTLLTILVAEAVLLSLWLDTGALARSTGLAVLVFRFGARLLRVGVALCVLFPVLSAARWKTAAAAVAIRTDLRCALLHVLALAGFAMQSGRIFSGGMASDLNILLWLGLAALLIGTATVAVFPVAAVRLLVRQFWRLATVSLAVAVAAVSAIPMFWRLWGNAAVLTFWMVRGLLHPLIPDLQADAVQKVLSSARFGVEIAPECSGYEGMALVTAFSVIWLWLRRKDYRFPRAGLLVPIGVMAIFCLNSVRIAALFLIGHLGAPQIALGGFHSQAGWIAFLLVSLSLAWFSTRVEWLAAAPLAGSGQLVGMPSADRANERVDDGTTAALVPFLAITAASILSSALSAEFEWLYPVRLVAALAAILAFRNDYRSLNWTLSWRPLLSALVVLAVWLGMEGVFPGAASTQDAAFRHAPVWWLAIRIVAASVTVPIAEELAFRHYGMRRLDSETFTQVAPDQVSMRAVVISSVVFGALHGSRWLAGTVAGLIFAYDYRRRNSIGDAVLAHGATNLLLSVYVMATGSWQLW